MRPLNIKCQNLFLFIQIAEGLDDSTWLYHLRRGDYSKWFRNIIRDHGLADETEQIEQDSTLSAVESRERIKEMIEHRYAPPAKILS